MITTDFLVIGSGIAGLTFAHKAASIGKVIIVTKKERSDANTNFAQGGIASVFSPDDNFDLHINDTLKTGDGLSHRDAVEIMVKEGPALVEELVQLGVEFTTRAINSKRKIFDLGMEGGHSRRRIVHSKDLTGKTIETSLLQVVKQHRNIQVFENHTGIELIVERVKGVRRCGGIYIYENESNQIIKILSQFTLLATGGVGQLYLHTTNPSIATGDGVAMAYRAGVPVANMEFIQFHPTSLYEDDTSNKRAFLISESVRGEGAFLKTIEGKLFMQKYHPMKSLAPRDIVARAIDTELKKSGDKYVLLDISSIGIRKFKKRFPNIYSTLVEKGILSSSNSIPVVPAAHYLCGGIVSDINARTPLDGLYTAGETAFTGVHGANRLASNSLLEALVFSTRAFNDAKKMFRKDFKHSGDFETGEFFIESGKRKIEKNIIFHNREVLRKIMWDYVGIVRRESRLTEALKRIRTIKEEVNRIFKDCQPFLELIELRNMVQVAELITYSALLRKESRGLNYNLDYPDKDDMKWKKDTIIKESIS
ncbi:MAG: L-aspartate oxidase [Candidatus Cloacimonas sp. 4484_209]|nr:MAG: L-aspartate oxidase [Candidatus Cloacimonas sp. 4484_209]